MRETQTTAARVVGQTLGAAKIIAAGQQAGGIAEPARSPHEDSAKAGFTVSQSVRILVQKRLVVNGDDAVEPQDQIQQDHQS